MNKKDKKERNRKGNERMRRFEKSNKKSTNSEIKSNDNFYKSEEYTITAFQKKEPGEWEKIEVPFKRKGT